VDHLNTPRLVADATGTTVWRWDQQEPFGVSPPDKNPSGLGVFDFPLRHAGQYDDPETGLFYNYFRDYDASIGRYVESDPIGLRGGVNTYAYVRSSPLLLIDPKGLEAELENYGACAYYQQGFQRSGCKYYALAARICRDELAVTTTLSRICMSTSQKNCVRKCLVEEDQQALNNPSCREECSTGRCPKLECVDQYHNKCFRQCGVSTGGACYGGNYMPWPWTFGLFGTRND
jgi:RHS repeat-associated protein